VVAAVVPPASRKNAYAARAGGLVRRFSQTPPWGMCSNSAPTMLSIAGCSGSSQELLSPWKT
jgi:hypothetical protein